MTSIKDLTQACLCCDSAMELLERVKELCADSITSSGQSKINKTISRIDEIRMDLDSDLNVQVRLSGFKTEEPLVAEVPDGLVME